MACTLQPWEIEVEERQSNAGKFGLDMNDIRVATEAACQACRILVSGGTMNEMSPFLQKWWAAHKEDDKKRVEPVPSSPFPFVNPQNGENGFLVHDGFDLSGGEKFVWRKEV